MTDIKQYEPLWGSWYVESLLGEGSFGKVYKIRKEEFGKNYYSAVKALSIPQNETDLRRALNEGLDEVSARSYFHAFVIDIIQEVDLMSAFRGNSNIVSLEDHKVIEKENEIGWDILIRMELLTSLSEYVTERPLPPSEVVKLGIHICRALELCALRKTIHRDIKPDNIFVSQYGEYKLGDFGIARQIERTLSGLSKKGTETYMAPEVFRGEEYGASVDLYSLGIVMYRYLNQNRPPFWPAFPNPVTPHDREEALQRRVKGEALPSIKDIDPALNEVVLRACAFDRKARFEDASEMKKALEPLANSENDAPVPEKFFTTAPSSISVERTYDAQKSPGRDFTFTADTLRGAESDKTEGVYTSVRETESTNNVGQEKPNELELEAPPWIVKKLAILSGVFFALLSLSSWSMGLENHALAFFALYALCVVQCVLQFRNRYMTAVFLLALIFYLLYSGLFVFEIFDYHLFIMTCSLFVLEAARTGRRAYGSLLCCVLMVCAFVAEFLVVRSIHGIYRGEYHAYVAGAAAIPFLMLFIALAGLFLMKKNTWALNCATACLIVFQFFPVLSTVLHFVDPLRGIASRGGIEALFYMTNATYLKMLPSQFWGPINVRWVGLLVQCLAFVPFFVLAFAQTAPDLFVGVFDKTNRKKLSFAVMGFVFAVAVLTEGVSMLSGFLLQ
jgi:serine/threonine protein kinase